MTDLSPSRKGQNQSGGFLYFRRTDFVVFPDDDLLQRFFRRVDWAHPELGVETFGWYYLLAATLYIVFVVCIACSRFGSVKLGPEQSKPEFSLLSWAAMLFAAGIGIDLMFFSVAEPVTQYMQPPEGAGRPWRRRARRWSGRCSTTG
jgi:choline/glycine/proline betaine transport protein